MTQSGAGRMPADNGLQVTGRPGRTLWRSPGEPWTPASAVSAGLLLARAAVDPGLEHLELIVCGHEICAHSPGDASDLTPQPEKFRGPLARHAHGLGQGDVQHGGRVAHAARHVDVGSGKPTILVHAHIALYEDAFALQLEGGRPGADAR